ncbi:MAG: hypothetical protein ACRCYS_11810 [Beijerinckiaceae bacterium]
MRDEDARECRAFGHSPKEALRLGLRSSTFALTALVDGSPHAMMGVAPFSVMENIGRPWMLGTDEVMRHSRELLTMGPMMIGELHRSFARLENLVSTKNSKAIRLLRRWGFDIGQDVQTIGGVDFVEFRKAYPLAFCVPRISILT